MVGFCFQSALLRARSEDHLALSCTGSVSAAVQLGSACQTSGSIPELVRAGAMQFFTCEEVAASQCDSSPEALRVPGASWAPLLREIGRAHV